MHALAVVDKVVRGHFPGAAEISNRVPPEELRRRVEREAERNRRHLGGFALLRIGAIDAGDSRALDEAVETETRRTDTVCRLADGSWAVLAVETGERGLRALAARLTLTAREISAGPVLPRYAAGGAASGERRVGADELWASMSAAFLDARRRGVPISVLQ